MKVNSRRTAIEGERHVCECSSPLHIVRHDAEYVDGLKHESKITIIWIVSQTRRSVECKCDRRECSAGRVNRCIVPAIIECFRLVRLHVASGAFRSIVPMSLMNIMDISCRIQVAVTFGAPSTPV
jgi:hypothetical protein